MRENKFSDLLHIALSDLVKWLDDSRIPVVVIGGVAAAILGKPRVTRDIDAVILVDPLRWNELLEAGKSFGFVPRISNMVEFAKKSHVFLLRHEPTDIGVDLSFAVLPFEQEMIKGRKTVRLKEVQVPLPRPEDLIVMKVIARRPRDLADIEGILEAQPKIDTKRVLHLVREFAELLEMPEILEDFVRILNARKKK